jgi:hypothetical protein
MATRAIARPIIVQMPRRSRGRIRRAGRRALHGVRRAGRHVRAHAGIYAPVSLIIGAVGIGYLLQKGYLKKVPQIGGSASFTLTALGFAALKWGRGRMFKIAGVVALIAGGVGFGREQAGGTSGLDETDELDERHV